MNDDPTAREVMISLNAHISGCSAMQRINLGFMGAVLVVLVTFAGYTYAQNQRLQEQQQVATQTALGAIRSSADAASIATVQKLQSGQPIAPAP